jgi:hypothetical protein
MLWENVWILSSYLFKHGSVLDNFTRLILEKGVLAPEEVGILSSIEFTICFAYRSTCS